MPPNRIGFHGATGAYQSIAAAKAVTNLANTPAIEFYDPLRGGRFSKVTASDYSALLAADTNNGLGFIPDGQSAVAFLRDDALAGALSPVAPITSRIETDWFRDAGDTEISYAYRRARDLAAALGLSNALGTPGVSIHLPPGRHMWAQANTGLHSNVKHFGHDTTLVIDASVAMNAAMMRATNDAGFDPDSCKYEGIEFHDICFDSSERPHAYWLTDAAGNAITDPEADYVPGTGALASTVTGVDITCTISSGQVQTPTVNNGGSGFTNSGDPFEYGASSVPLVFTGGDPTIPASGYANISGGSLTTCVLTFAGRGYQSAPTISTAGGAFAIEKLVDTAGGALNRRNSLGYSQASNYVLSLSQIKRLLIKNCKFIKASRTNLITGCHEPVLDGNEFEDCGKRDGTHFINYFGAATGYNKNIQVINSRSYRRDFTIPHCGTFMASGQLRGENYIGHNYHEESALAQFSEGTVDGQIYVEDNTLYNLRRVGGIVFAAEGPNADNIHCKGTKIFGSDGSAWGVYSGANLTFEDEEYHDLFRDSCPFPEFTPATERWAEVSVPTRPLVYDMSHMEEPGAILVGNRGERPALGTKMKNIRLYDDRTAAGGDLLPAVARLFRVDVAGESTSAGIAKDITFENCERLFKNGQRNPDLPLFLGNAADDLFDEDYSFYVADNPGHKSASMQRLETTYGGTGVKEIRDIGFPPKRIKVYAFDTTNNGRICDAELIWVPGASTYATNMSVEGRTFTKNQGAGDMSSFVGPTMIRLRDANGTVVFEAEWVRQYYDGIDINVTVRTAPTICNVTFLFFAR